MQEHIDGILATFAALQGELAATKKERDSLDGKARREAEACVKAKADLAAAQKRIGEFTASEELHVKNGNAMLARIAELTARLEAIDSTTEAKAKREAERREALAAAQKRKADAEAEIKRLGG